MPGKTRTAPGLLALAFLLAAAGWSAAGESKREQAQRWLDAAVDAHAKLDFGKALQAAGSGRSP